MSGALAGKTQSLGLESSGGSLTHMSGIWTGVTWTLDSADSINWRTYTWPFLMVWASSQHGGLRIVKLLTWQLRSPAWASQETRRKLHHAVWTSFRIHVVSFPLNCIVWSSNKCAQFDRGGHIDLNSQWEEYQNILWPLKKKKVTAHSIVEASKSQKVSITCHVKSKQIIDLEFLSWRKP